MEINTLGCYLIFEVNNALIFKDRPTPKPLGTAEGAEAERELREDFAKLPSTRDAVDAAGAYLKTVRASLEKQVDESDRSPTLDSLLLLSNVDSKIRDMGVLYIAKLAEQLEAKSFLSDHSKLVLQQYAQTVESGDSDEQFKGAIKNATAFYERLIKVRESR